MDRVSDDEYADLDFEGGMEEVEGSEPVSDLEEDEEPPPANPIRAAQMQNPRLLALRAEQDRLNAERQRAALAAERAEWERGRVAYGLESRCEAAKRIYRDLEAHLQRYYNHQFVEGVDVERFLGVAAALINDLVRVYLEIKQTGWAGCSDFFAQAMANVSTLLHNVAETTVGLNRGRYVAHFQRLFDLLAPYGGAVVEVEAEPVDVDLILEIVNEGKLAGQSDAQIAATLVAAGFHPDDFRAFLE